MSPKSEKTGRARSPSGPPHTDDLAALCAAHAPVSANGRFDAGTVFGDWRLTAFIGRGGNGEVYCAEHATLGTPAAVKVLVREEERARMRFAHEAKLLSSLKSGSFPRFFAYGEANGHPYLAMELLEPGELPAGERAIARFLLRVCDAVAELHAQGLVHRDIKPGNILWRSVGVRVPRARGRASLPPDPVLADLGLVKDTSPSNPQTFKPSNAPVTLGGVGTPGYGAPEQMERGEATVAADIHALGVLADRCFDGKPPRAWTRIIQRATSSIPAHRYQSVAALARAIRRRHLFRKVLFYLGSVGVLAMSAIYLQRTIKSLYGKYQAMQALPVISASAMVDDEKADDARWFIDGNPIAMPHRVVETDSHGSPGDSFHLYAVVKRSGKTYSAKKRLYPNWHGVRKVSMKLRQDPAAGDSIRIWAPGGIPFDFVWCPPGEEIVGCNDTNGNLHTARVSVGCGYWIARNELTHRQYGAICGAGVARFTWIHTIDRINRNSELPVMLDFHGPATVPAAYIHGSGIRFEPPDVLQWEHAAQLGGGLPPETDISSYAWTIADKKGVSAEGKDFPFKGGRKRPNALGMYDVYGNVPEWVWVSSDLRKDGKENKGGWLKAGGSYAHDYSGLKDCAEKTARLLCGLSVPVHAIFGPFGPGDGTGAAGVRFVAISYLEHETNTVLYCVAKDLLRSNAPEEIARGEAMMKGFVESDDSELALLARECCIERRLLSVEDCGGTNAPSILRLR